MAKDTKRVISFSVPPGDTKSRQEVQKLKDYCSKTGTNFSFLVIKAIVQQNKELNL